MSVVLTLIPVWECDLYFRDGTVKRTISPYERIRFSEPQNSNLLIENVRKLRPEPLPENVSVILRERNSEPTRSDPYGDIITWVSARAFKDFKNATEGRHEWPYKWDDAVLGFLQKIPGDTPVILFWS